MYELHIRNLGLQEYDAILNKMRDFTRRRNADSLDELWCLQHSPVFTLGANADQQHILSRSEIPILQSDRGGQVTYHGPGQAIIYLLVDLRRKSIGVKRLVSLIEQSVVELLEDYGITSQARTDAHGVYVNGAKIASLGLRVHSGCSYHGLALNIDMDLSPFSLINPCGLPNMPVTQLKDHGVTENLPKICENLINKLSGNLEYKRSNIRFHDQ